MTDKMILVSMTELTLRQSIREVACRLTDDLMIDEDPAVMLADAEELFGLCHALAHPITEADADDTAGSDDIGTLERAARSLMGEDPLTGLLRDRRHDPLYPVRNEEDGA